MVHMTRIKGFHIFAGIGGDICSGQLLGHIYCESVEIYDMKII